MKADLAERFRRHVDRAGLLPAGRTLLVAVSGGMDSVVLLHLLRFHPPSQGLRLVAASFDHRMRPDSGDDIRWVRGLARAWEVPLVEGVAERPPGSEAEARTARYAFLRREAVRAGAGAVATAHHADDQAETVLFRVARGTGIRGLAAMRASGPGPLVRPLLPFWRAELAEWAAAARIGWRDDPTNLARDRARNVLRHDVLPRIEEAVAPGARRSLVRLARIAAREERAWRSVLPELLRGIVLDESGARISLDRDAFLSRDPAVRARVLRVLAERLGVSLDGAGTRAALEFSSRSASGRRHALPGGAVLVREFDRLVLSAAAPEPESRSGGEGALEIPEPGEGRGTLELRTRAYHVRWGPGPPIDGTWVEGFGSRRLTFPLRVRGWLPGDRIRLPYGSKKLKKLFVESRIPRSERDARPVLVDGRGRVLWVPGVARAAEPGSAEGGADLTIGIMDADDV